MGLLAYSIYLRTQTGGSTTTGVWGGVGVGVALLASLVLQQLGKRRGNKSA